MVQSDPQQIAPAPRWWRRRWFVVTVILIAALYTIEPAIGTWIWRSYQKEAAAKGVKLRFEDYRTPPVPGDENYAAVPLFQRLFDKDSNNLKKLTGQLELPNRVTGKSLPRSATKPLDLTEWQATFLHKKWILTAGSNPASDVLAALERLEGPLSEIRIASARPKASWPVDWSEGPEARMPIYGVLHNASMAFGLRARALLALDRSDEALVELRHIVRASESIEELPMLISGLVREKLWNQILDVAMEGAIAGKWKPSHFDELSRWCRIENHLEKWKFSLSSERALITSYMDRLATAPPWKFPNEFRGVYSFGKSFEPVAAIFGLGPRGWVRRNEVEYQRYFDTDVDDIDAGAERVGPEFSRAQAKVEGASVLSTLRLSHRLAKNAMPLYVQASFRAFATHTRIRQMPVAFALIRYRDARGLFPESLDQLLPEYMDSIPHDIMDGKPMRYRRTQEGSCVLWSIGKNRIDDGGTRGPKKDPSIASQLDWITELR